VVANESKMGNELKPDSDNALFQHIATELRQWQTQSKQAEMDAQVEIAKVQLPILLEQQRLASENAKTFRMAVLGGLVIAGLTVLTGGALLWKGVVTIDQMWSTGTRTITVLGAGAIALVGKDVVAHFRKPK
jgi:hypothetical protein